jgi:hypothetical protein
MSADLRGYDWAKLQVQKGAPLTFPTQWTDEDRTLPGELILEALLSAHLYESGLAIENAIVTDQFTK